MPVPEGFPKCAGCLGASRSDQICHSVKSTVVTAGSSFSRLPAEWGLGCSRAGPRYHHASSHIWGTRSRLGEMEGRIIRLYNGTCYYGDIQQLKISTNFHCHAQRTALTTSAVIDSRPSHQSIENVDHYPLRPTLDEGSTNCVGTLGATSTSTFGSVHCMPG